jgi:hypothetical protein
MLGLFRRFVETKMLSYLFVTSRDQMKFEQFLEANQYYDDGLLVNPKRFGFRLRLGRAYLFYLLLIHIFIIPMVGIFHTFFAKMDCHFSILLVMVATWLFFILFTIFKEWLYEVMTLNRIKKAWSLHLPLFDYDKYHLQVSMIYSESQKQSISKNSLQMFVLDALSKE